MDNSLKPIEDFITSGLAERFFKVFGVPLLFYNGPEVKQVASKMLKQRKLPEYPFARAKFSNVAISENTYKPNTLMRRGLKSRASHDNVLAYELDLAPVSTTYELTIYMQDIQSVRKFVKDWMFTCLRGNLKFSVSYGVADIDVDIDLERQIAIPERPSGNTDVKEYELTTQFVLHGYYSADLRTTQSVTDLEVQIQVLEEMGLKGGKVDIIYIDWPSCLSCSEVPVNPGEPGTGEGDKNFVYTRDVPSTVWSITHNMNKMPSVTLTDSNGAVVEATVHYASLNVVVVSFDFSFTGTAYLN